MSGYQDAAQTLLESLMNPGDSVRVGERAYVVAVNATSERQYGREGAATVIMLARERTTILGRRRVDWTPLTWPDGALAIVVPDYGSPLDPSRWTSAAQRARRIDKWIYDESGKLFAAYAGAALDGLCQRNAGTAAETLAAMAASPLPATRRAAEGATVAPPRWRRGANLDRYAAEVARWEQSRAPVAAALVAEHAPRAAKWIHSLFATQQGHNVCTELGYALDGYQVEYRTPGRSHTRVVTMSLLSQNGVLVEEPPRIDPATQAERVADWAITKAASLALIRDAATIAGRNIRGRGQEIA